ncbi:MAG: AEC family transporter [Lachnospiraceae bacterium]|nr:AEC family transporter [Lachnospiraceae bacterium]
MELSLLLGKQTLSMFLILAVGYTMVKCGWFQAKDSEFLSRLAVYVVVPCSLFHAFQVEFSPDKLSGFLLSLGAAVLIQGLFILVTGFLKKPMKFTPVESASLIYPNALNMVLPLVTATLGEGYIFYTVPFCVVQVVLLWTHGRMLLSGEKHVAWRSILLNTNILSVALGLFCFLTGIRLPEILDTAVTNLGNMIGPLGMLIAGMLMTSVDLKRVFGNGRAYKICFFRLILLPLITVFVLRFGGFSSLHPEAETIFLVTTLAAASCSATSVIQFSQIFGEDGGYASVLNGMSILFCILTIPLMIFIYQIL